MQCKLCGFKFDESQIINRGCSNCGKHNCNLIHCPNCGFGNSPEYGDEFKFIQKLKTKLQKN